MTKYLSLNLESCYINLECILNHRWCLLRFHWFWVACTNRWGNFICCLKQTYAVISLVTTLPKNWYVTYISHSAIYLVSIRIKQLCVNEARSLNLRSILFSSLMIYDLILAFFSWLIILQAFNVHFSFRIEM